MADLELSCGLPPGPGFAEHAVLAEELGYARVWIFDSAPLWEDPFVHLALAAERTKRIGLGTAVLVPSQRSVVSTASAIATLARLSRGRLRVGLGTGFTARLMLGKRPIPLDALFDYARSLRRLLSGETATVEGVPVRLMHAPGTAAPRPIEVPLWLSVFGPRGAARAEEVADGIIGRPHPTLPSATLVSGSVLDPGEDPGSRRVREAVGPWRVVDWHAAYASGGAEAVDALPSGRAWREELESLAPEGERHLLAFEGHVTQLTGRDERLLEHVDVRTGVGDRARIARSLERLASAGYREILYTPSGPDVARELRAFAAMRDDLAALGSRT